MRLVDADALVKEAGKLWSEMPDGEELSKELMKAINHAPTIDAVPVKHGQWTEQHVDYASDCAIDEIQELKCSVCGLYHTTPYMYNITHYKFCPNCGAKMDLEDEQ